MLQATFRLSINIARVCTAGNDEAKAFASNTTDGWVLSTATGACYHNGRRVDWSWPSAFACPEFHDGKPHRLPWLARLRILLHGSPFGRWISGDTVGILVDLSSKMFSVYVDVRHSTFDMFVGRSKADKLSCDRASVLLRFSTKG